MDASYNAEINRLLQENENSYWQMYAQDLESKLALYSSPQELLDRVTKAESELEKTKLET